MVTDNSYRIVQLLARPNLNIFSPQFCIPLFVNKWLCDLYLGQEFRFRTGPHTTMCNVAILNFMVDGQFKWIFCLKIVLLKKIEAYYHSRSILL